VILAVVYVLDALLIGFVTPTNSRLQFIWTVTDTSLAAVFIASMATVVCRCLSPHHRQARLDENAAGTDTVRA